MYGKHFQSMYSGSMCGAGADIFAVWGYVIAHARDGFVDLNPDFIAMVLGMTSDRVSIALGFLCSPDPKSRSKEHEGRRLVREGEYLYHVPQSEKYRSIKSLDEKRSADRIRQAKHRAKISDVTSHTASHATSHHPDPDPDPKSNKDNIGQQAGRFPEFWKAYPRKVKKKTSLHLWKTKKLDLKCDELLHDIEGRLREDAQWKQGYIPHPSTYLSQERWNDEITRERPKP